jgi:hypothetical protein
LVPGLALYGAGIGFAGAQLTNVVLSEIPPESSGVASGANTTMRQVGSALGVSVIGALLTVKSIASARASILHSSLPALVKSRILGSLHAGGSALARPPAGDTPVKVVVQRALAHGVTTGTRWALAFAVAVIAGGGLMSLLIPTDRLQRRTRTIAADDAVVSEP